MNVRKGFYGFLIVWETIGLVLTLTIGVPASLAWSGGIYLMLTAVVAYEILVMTIGKPGARILTLFIGLFGFCIEVIGVHTGVPFGRYGYRDQLGPLLFQVPIAMAFAWITVIVIGFSLTPKKIPRLYRILIGTAITTSIDFLLDPVAANILHDWTWHFTKELSFYGIGWQNYAAWFVLSAFLHSALTLFPTRQNAYRRGLFLFGSLYLLFAIIALVHALVIPMVIPLCLVAINLYFKAKERFTHVDTNAKVGAFT